MARTVHVVPHTHWDREWYRPFPVFRVQLVELLDGLLATLDTQPEYRHFQLDGQMAVIDDYLEIRPHERERLERLNRSGRITMGPWYTLPDEFLVSGETHVRNLRLGLEKARAMGGAMEVGYLPDMFGHVAQMPQILAGFGFTHAVVWRGVPRSIQAPAFWWSAPDGTRVRAEYLADGYGNGARLPADGRGLIEQVASFRSAQGVWAGDDLLWMHGTDHQLPDPHLPEVIADAGRIAAATADGRSGPAGDADGDGSETATAADTVDRYEITSLIDHLERAPVTGLPGFTGELRSGARSNLLMGVASCRTDVKQAASRAERWLERIAEPLLALTMPGEDWPAELLAVAWREVIRNAAHDSICGCSADEVNRAVLHRYAEATRVAEALTDRGLVRILASSGQPTVVVNTTNRTRSAMVTAITSGDEALPHTQQISVRPAVITGPTLPAATARPVVLRAALEDPRVSRVELVPDRSTGSERRWRARVVADRSTRTIDVDTLRSQLRDLAADPDATVTLETVRAGATQELLLIADRVPGFGWRGLAPAPLGDHAVRPSDGGLTNGLVTVSPDQEDGTFALDGLTGLGRLVDDGDAGDTYNWSPTLDASVLDHPTQVDVMVTEAGPVRGRIEITRTYRWPTHARDDLTRAGSVEVETLTVVELRAGEDLVRVSVELVNPARDHRLRIHFPLPHPAEGSEAGCAFTTVSRSLTAEGGPNEVGLATFPSRRFVNAGGLLVVHDGTPEYEVVDDGRELAVTLFRSVGVISRGPMAMRALPAGPPTPTPDAQMTGPIRTELVLHAGGRNPYEVADQAFVPLLTARGPGAKLGDAAVGGTLLEVSGAEVSALTRRADGRLELRLYNPTGSSTEASVAGHVGELTDLNGRTTGSTFDGTVTLAPHQIVTLALTPAP